MLSSSYWNIRLNLNNLSKSVQNQINHIKKMSTELNKITDLYSKTELAILDIEKTQAEIDEKERQTRQTIANIAKFAVFALCVVATAAVIIGTGGAATPLVLGGVSAITAVAQKATNELADEFAEKGNWDNMDWKEFGKDVTVAGVTGFISGWAGGTITEGLKGVSFVKPGLESTNFLSRISTNAGINAVSDVVVGIGERGVTSTAEVMFNNDFETNVKTLGSLGVYSIGAVTNNSALQRIALQDSNVETIVNNTFDVKEICKDTISGAFSGSVDEIVDTASTIKHFDSNFLNSDNAVKRGISGFGVEGVKGAVSKMGENFEETLIDGGSAGEAVQKAFDPISVGKAFVENGVKEGAKRYRGKPVGEAILTENKLNDPDIARAMPNSIDARQWIRDGGSIYRDSAGKLTFQKTDTESSNVFVKPKIRLCYSSN